MYSIISVFAVSWAFTLFWIGSLWGMDAFSIDYGTYTILVPIIPVFAALYFVTKQEWYNTYFTEPFENVLHKGSRKELAVSFLVLSVVYGSLWFGPAMAALGAFIPERYMSFSEIVFSSGKRVSYFLEELPGYMTLGFVFGAASWIFQFARVRKNKKLQIALWAGLVLVSTAGYFYAQSLYPL